MRNAEEANTLRLRVEYADHNEPFAALLPRSGVVEGTYSDIRGNSGWCLLGLDEPFEYQLEVGEPFGSRLIRVAQFLLRSRWAGHAIGGTEPTSVFILLVESGQPPIQDPIDPKAYVHVAWGTAVTEA